MGALFIFVVCPIIGALPLIYWITYALSGKKLTQLGTGNISVSSAFYHGGRLVGILAVISEAFKGIVAVLMTRYFFPTESTWEIFALIALVMGRYWWAKGAGVTNVTWGLLFHNPIATLLVILVGGVSFTLFREKKSGRFAMLGLMVAVFSLQNPHQSGYVFAIISLASLLAWIIQNIPDDLDLDKTQVNQDSAKMFNFFRGDKSISNLDETLKIKEVGNKAFNLSQLKKWGYDVPPAWILKPGDDVENFVNSLSISPQNPLAVRSSAIGEDGLESSAAGIYASFLNITNQDDLINAIFNCLASYDTSQALQYRKNRQETSEGMAVIVQKQIKGLFSGVAFSRDPVNQLQDSVTIEALQGDCLQVVSGVVTPNQYRVFFPSETIESKGNIPEEIIIKVAKIAREIETLSKNIPQDIEWTYDGETLWLLQTRPITTLQPLWTRKIASEVIPGVIKPLTWSINRPLTCGVWGKIFTLVLGKKATNLDFENTATLHYQRAYFNATLLGDIFLLMGLPAESLEFLTRGAKFTKPPLISTIKNLPGLWRLFQKELSLEKDFSSDGDRHFMPFLDELGEMSVNNLSPIELLNRIEKILFMLEKITYYSIFAPLSFALRQAILKVDLTDLDNSKTPEIIAIQTLKEIAVESRNSLPKNKDLNFENYASFFGYLADNSDGESILNRFNLWLTNYGYLSDIATDISIPRWLENSNSVKELFTKFIFENEVIKDNIKPNKSSSKILLNNVQKRLNLKGKVTEIYSQFLAELRYSFLALETKFLAENLLINEGDIFFLELDEIRNFINNTNNINLINIVRKRRLNWIENIKIENVPYLIYGNPPPFYLNSSNQLFIDNFSKDDTIGDRQYTGIGASAGIVEGRIKILLNIANQITISPNTILVVPYTDSGWTAILIQASGLITEVGGKLSHGAIIAREFGIPAVMDIHHATKIFQDGQLVRIDGSKGIIEIIS